MPGLCTARTSLKQINQQPKKKKKKGSMDDLERVLPQLSKSVKNHICKRQHNKTRQSRGVTIRAGKQCLHAYVRTFTNNGTSFKRSNQCTDGCRLSHFKVVAAYVHQSQLAGPTGTGPATVTDASYARLKGGGKKINKKVSQ